MGLIAILAILMAEWNQGKELKNEVVISILAMIYYVFFSVNVLTYYALTHVANFAAVLYRLS